MQSMQQDVVMKMHAVQHAIERTTLTPVSSVKLFCMCAKMKARQKAVSALETQIAELTQQLYESDQSRLQLEQQLEVQRSSNAADAAAAKVG